MNRFTQNPEFRRNLWLEFSPQRLMLMPAIILLALFAVGTVSGKDTPSVILTASILGFGVLTAFWGCLQACNALHHELSEGTWDGQRMSSLTSWQMTWGKLLGGPIYAWYGGGILLLVACLAFFLMMYYPDGGSGYPFGPMDFFEFLRAMLPLALIALLFQAASMMMLLLRWQRQPGKKPGRVGAIGLLLLFWIAGGALFSFISTPSGFALFIRAQTQGGFVWYGLMMETSKDFLLATLFALTVWAVIGLWQLMRRELQNRNRPWWWLAFLLFWIVWGAGFGGKKSAADWVLFCCVCAVPIWLSGYILLFSERKDLALWIRLVAAWKRRDSALLQHLLPNWPVSFAVALVLSLIALFLSPLAYGDGSGLFRGVIFLISIVAFVLRDAAWILWLNLAPGARRADGAALVYLVVAYGVLPMTSARFFRPTAGRMNGDSFFRSMLMTEIDLLALAAHIILAAVAIGFFYARFRKTFAGK
jgi:hypothetical protein